jgi:hypothetical protein
MPSQASTTARGYGTKHQNEKRRLSPIVEAYGAICSERICLMPSRLIPPGTQSWQWDLAHTEDRTSYLGPAHIRCNRSAGIRHRNATRRPYRRWAL